MTSPSSVAEGLSDGGSVKKAVGEVRSVAQLQEHQVI